MNEYVDDLMPAAEIFAKHLTRMNAETITVKFNFANGRTVVITATDYPGGESEKDEDEEAAFAEADRDDE